MLLNSRLLTVRASAACGGAHFTRRTCALHCGIQRRVQAEVAASVHAYLNKVSDRLTVNATTLRAFGLTKGHRGSCSVCICLPEPLTTTPPLLFPLLSPIHCLPSILQRGTRWINLLSWVQRVNTAVGAPPKLSAFKLTAAHRAEPLCQQFQVANWEPNWESHSFDGF